MLTMHRAWWRNQMETFSALLAPCVGNSPVTGEFPQKRPVTRGLMFSLIRAWINGWVNNREAGDLRRHRAHYDVTVMGTELQHTVHPNIMQSWHGYMLRINTDFKQGIHILPVYSLHKNAVMQGRALVVFVVSIDNHNFWANRVVAG